MSETIAVVPDESDLLCEGCGYTLRGIPTDGRCPECGKAISESVGVHRLPPAWETPDDPRGAVTRFCATTIAVMFRPSAFFSSLAARRQDVRAKHFAWIHWSISSLVFGVAVWLHLVWYADVTRMDYGKVEFALSFFIPIAILALTALTNRLAAWLTNLEATWRGLRMPTPVVRRALFYHAPHYLVPGLLVLAIVSTMHLLALFDVIAYYGTLYGYIYAQCIAIILSAVYLFHTYWIAMRKIMYANR